MGLDAEGVPVRIVLERVTCEDCKAVSDVELVADAPIPVVVASMKSARCPHCKSSKLGLGGNYKDAPPLSAPMAHRIAWWDTRGERGISSNTIYSVLAPAEIVRWDIPYDPDDFRRCKQLLDLVPEWRERLLEVAEVFPFWKPYTDAWDELDALYEAEASSGKAPKLYDRMKVLEEESNKLRSRRCA
jgi:hypothetical protein